MELKDHPTISVIIIVFNGAKYIKTAIESVLRQTFRDFEIIVIDDGSTDNTKEVLDHWINNGKIRYYYQQNRGTSVAYNSGTNLAKGKYIKYLDSDDWLYPEQLELQVKHLQNKPETIISVTDYEFDFAGKAKKKVNLWLEKKHQLSQFIADNPCPCHTILFPRNLLIQAGLYDEKLSCYEDTDLWIRILLQGGIFEKLDYVGCCYRILEGSVSSDPEKMFQQRCKFYEKLNLVLISKVDKLPDNQAIQQLLLANFQLINMCFARKLEPATYMPTIFKANEIVYNLEKRGWRKLLFKIIGINNIAVLKYLKACLSDRNYQQKLLGTPWRQNN